MRFASLGSGSQGNATLIEWKKTCLMIDCGFSVKQVTKRLKVLGKTPQDLSAILVTHEHSDHWKGVLPLASLYSIDIYLTAGCLRAVELSKGSFEGIKLIESGLTFQIGDLSIQPVSVPHDAREPVQYLFFSAQHKLGILTDLGSVTPHIVDLYSDCDGLIIEANHDLELLSGGSYPAFLKDRVGGPWGHLNNHQTAGLIEKIDQQRIQHIVVAHISQGNNDLERVKQAIASVYNGSGNLCFASQKEGFDWLHLVE